VGGNHVYIRGVGWATAEVNDKREIGASTWCYKKSKKCSLADTKAEAHLAVDPVVLPPCSSMRKSKQVFSLTRATSKRHYQVRVYECSAWASNSAESVRPHPLIRRSVVKASLAWLSFALHVITITWRWWQTRIFATHQTRDLNESTTTHFCSNHGNKTGKNSTFYSLS